MTGDVGYVEVLAQAQGKFDAVHAWAQSPAALSLTHGDLEVQVLDHVRDIGLSLVQAILTIRALQEQRVEVVDADGIGRGTVEAGRCRNLTTILGTVIVDRFAYRHCGDPDLFPADGELNLPVETYSHGVRRFSAIEASRGSFDETVTAIERATGVRVGKRQVEDLAVKASFDFTAYYDQKTPAQMASGDVMALSCDGKGIVMRPDALRPATAKIAAGTKNKIDGRLSKGEKPGRKRMAEIGAVYNITPIARSPVDIISTPGDPQPIPGPTATNKWLTASVEASTATVIGSVFNEADRRDPDHQHQWIALVDGNKHQLDRIHAEAAARDITVPIIIDIVHVIEYLWKAAWSFHQEGNPAAEVWVRAHILDVLAGNAVTVANNLRADATEAQLTKTKRKGADTCARYLTDHADYLDYPTALASGWPIATGIIEGACRHLVKDRMDSPAQDGDSKAPKPSSNSAPYAPTATSTTTGATTSHKNTTATTPPATKTTPSRPPRRHHQKSHTQLNSRRPVESSARGRALAAPPARLALNVLMRMHLRESGL